MKALTLDFLMAPMFAGFFEMSWRGRTAWLSLCFFASWDEGRHLGRCWPSQASLAEIFGVSRDSIIRGLNELEKRGVIKREASEGESCTYSLQPQGVSFTAARGIAHSNTNNTINKTRNKAGGTLAEGTLTEEQSAEITRGFWEQFRQYNPDGEADAKKELRRLFHPGMPLEEALARQEELLSLLNAKAPEWERNLESDERRRFNPGMGPWLRRQFGGKTS